jgi:hypothetical protein
MTFTNSHPSRRQVLLGAASLSLGAGPARSQAATPFVILSHRVHQQTATSADRPGGDVIAD